MSTPIDDDIDLPGLPDTRPEVKQHRIHDAFDHDVAYKIGFVGVGQGGGRIAETAYKIGYRRVAVINSAYEDLKDILDEIPKLDLKTGGAGQDMERGASFFRAKEEDARDLLVRAIGEDVDYLIVCASLGGGTGSGAISPLIQLCRKYLEDSGRDPKRVGVMVSLPNSYEGQRTSRNAVMAFGQIYQLQPSPMIIIDNQRMEKLFSPVGATELFKKCNDNVMKLFHLFNRLASERSQLITFDRADYGVLLDSGIVVYGASPIRQYNTKADLCECIRAQLSDTAFAEVDMKAGRAAGCIFLGSEKILGQVPMEWFGAGFDQMSRLMADDNTVFRGVYIGSAADLRCYTMLSGLPAPTVRLRELSRKAGTAIKTDWLDVAD